MAIPGRTLDKVETRAKIRTGIKVNGFPRSTDYFVSDDPEIVALGEKPKRIVVELPYATAEECFGTGLEWWAGKLLACYTKDGGANPVALRVPTMKKQGGDVDLLEGETVVGPAISSGRTPIACRADACPFFGKNADNKKCRPMGRLQFFVAGGRTDAALGLDTKGWNTIENLAGTLAAAQRSGPLNAPGRRFVLSVVMEGKARDKYPVVSIEEENVPLTTEKGGIAKADALVAIESGKAMGKPAREVLAEALDFYKPGWREDERYVSAIKEKGVDAALALMHDRLLAEAAA